MREAYPYPARGVKNEAKLVSEKYLCKNFKTKLVWRGLAWFQTNVVPSQTEFSTKRKITRVVEALI